MLGDNMVARDPRYHYCDYVDQYVLYCIPSYDTIGIWAPILLLICKMAQGFSVGGEYTGASIFVAEYSLTVSVALWAAG